MQSFKECVCEYMSARVCVHGINLRCCILLFSLFPSLLLGWQVLFIKTTFYLSGNAKESKWMNKSTNGKWSNNTKFEFWTAHDRVCTMYASADDILFHFYMNSI